MLISISSGILAYLNGKAYIIGGSRFSNITSAFTGDVYDPVTNTWSPSRSTIGECHDNCPYTHMAKADVYDTVEDKWSLFRNTQEERHTRG